jgi:hypothetical protein
MLKDTKGTKKYIWDVVCNTTKNILYFIFFELRVVGKHNVRNVGGCWKGPRKKFLKNEGHQNKTSWMPKMLMFNN